MEAAEHSARADDKGGSTRWRYYVPAARIELVDGLTVSRDPEATRGGWIDRYTGTPEVLAASGIAPLELLPGSPGVPSVSVSYRPQGVPKSPDGWHRTPGYLQVTRSTNGLLRALLTVPADEQERRAAASRAAWQARQARAAALPKSGPLEQQAQAELLPGVLLFKMAGSLMQQHGAEAVIRHLEAFRSPAPRRPGLPICAWRGPRLPRRAALAHGRAAARPFR